MAGVPQGSHVVGKPWRVSLCRWSDVPLAISQQVFLVLVAATSESSSPCSLASDSMVWRLWKEASYPEGPKCLVEARIKPFPSFFPSMLFF